MMRHNTTARFTLAAAAILTFCTARGAEVPRPSPDDPRVRYVKYSAGDVTVVRVRRGTSTRIVLGDDEQIIEAVPGFSSRCDKDEDEWCINAATGTNRVFIRPRDGASTNNLELHTNKRDYSFEFDVLRDKAATDAQGRAARTGAGEPFHRVIFEYPKPPALARAAVVAGLLAGVDAGTAATPGVPDSLSPAERLKLEPARMRNANYTMQVLEHGEDAAPSMVFDDGRFTYFEFQGAREIPEIEAYGSDGEPVRVNWHMQPPFLVVERTARKFTLRLGQAVTGVFNEAFDAVGVDTPNATVSASVRRVIKAKAE